jgi:hypothetical protein
MTRDRGRNHPLCGFRWRTLRVGGPPQFPSMLGLPERAVVRIKQAVRRSRRRRQAGLLALLLLPLLTGVGAFALGRARPAPPVSVVVQEVEIVKEVPKLVEVHESQVPPILRKIARCESQNTHYDRQGHVLQGRANPHDVGKYQINTAVWGPVAARLGYDLYDEQGNEQMALYLLHHYGSLPWQQSAPCWGRQ